MSDIQHPAPEREETAMREPEIVSEFAAWIERVTEPITTAAAYQPRHRADGDAR